MSKDFLITGIPRSGTSFVCSLINRLPDVVALNETMNMKTLLLAPDTAAKVATLKTYFTHVRDVILTRHMMPQHELSGIDDNMFLTNRSSGRKSAKVGKVALVELGRELSPNFSLGLKNLNVFALHLPEIEGHFDCWALVRNPLATLASWHTIDNPVRRGFIMGAKVLGLPLADTLANIKDDRSRRLALLDWYYRRFTEVLGLDRIKRYEDIVSTNGGRLADLFHSASTLPNLAEAPLENRNHNPLYGDAVGAIVDAEALLEDRHHTCWRVYQRSEVRALLSEYKRRKRMPGLAIGGPE